MHSSTVTEQKVLNLNLPGDVLILSIYKQNIQLNTCTEYSASFRFNAYLFAWAILTRAVLSSHLSNKPPLKRLLTHMYVYDIGKKKKEKNHYFKF